MMRKAGTITTIDRLRHPAVTAAAQEEFRDNDLSIAPSKRKVFYGGSVNCRGNQEKKRWIA